MIIILILKVLNLKVLMKLFHRISFMIINLILVFQALFEIHGITIQTSPYLPSQLYTLKLSYQSIRLNNPNH